MSASQSKVTTLVILIVLASIPLMLSIPPKTVPVNQTAIASSTTVHRTFWLLGSVAGWNQTRPGPLVTVTDGDLVTIMYNSIDTAPHTWFIDVNNNEVPDPGEISSATVAASSMFVNFTFTLKVGTNIPSTGDFTYRCSIHPQMMFGTFRVLASTAPNFMITANPIAIGPLNIRVVGTSTITVTAINGFTGTVTLTASPSSGLNATVSPMTLLGGSGTATLAVNSTTFGSYSVIVTGTGSPGTQSVTVTVTVVGPDFGIVLSPSALMVAPGSSATVRVNLTSINGFSGTVSLTSALSSPGPLVTFSPASVIVPASGSMSSTVSVSAASSGAYSTPASQGSYTVTVTGTSGLLSHFATFSLTVGSSSSVGGLTSSALIGGGIAAVIAVVAVAIYIIRRKNKT